MESKSPSSSQSTQESTLLIAVILPKRFKAAAKVGASTELDVT